MEAYVSCFSTDFEVMRKSWDAKREDRSLSAEDQARYERQSGCVLKFSNYSDNDPESVIEQKCPFGMLLEDEVLYVCDAKDNFIQCYKSNLEPSIKIASCYFNDIHSITSDNSSLLVASSGNDAVLRIINNEIEPLLSFGHDTSDQLIIDRIDQTIDYSQLKIPTAQQLTHVNFATRLNDGRIGATLFHQGLVVAIDCDDRKIEVLADNLLKPHSFFEHNDMLFIADSGRGAVKILDSSSLREIKNISYNGWIQELHLDTDSELISVINADSSEVYIFDTSFNEMERLKFPRNMRLASFILKGIM